MRRVLFFQVVIALVLALYIVHVAEQRADFVQISRWPR